MKPSRKHKTSAAQRIKDGNRELREALRRQSQELQEKNRELEIEASLERVRARAIAMQSSSELADLIAMIHSEMGRLDKNLDRSFIMLFNNDGSSTWWMAGNEAMAAKRGYYVPKHDHAPYLALLQGWKKKMRKWTHVLKGEVKKKWDTLLFTKTEMAQLPKKVKAHMIGFKVAYFNASFNKYGCIFTGSFEALDSQSVDLLVRFSRMFEQTYTRFLDLQKAESQAREAQIEAALEKVRSSSLAMHKSDELQKVVSVLFNKLEELGLAFDATLIYIFDKGKKSIRAWIASSILSSPVKVNLPYDEGMAKNQVIKDLWRATETGEDMFNKVYSGKAKNDYILHSFKHNQSSISKATKNLMIKARGWTVSFAAERNSVVGFDSWSGHITSEEDFRIVKRFSKVFEQTYTRFLDLQKAEAQARESQIEAALEKVRSRSMGMQKSSELREVVATVFQQLQNLGFNLNFCNIILFDLISLDAIYWLSFDEQKVIPEGYHVPYSNHPLYQYQLDAWRNEASFAAFDLSGKSKTSWDKYISNLPDIRNLSASIVKTIQKIRKLTLVSVATKNGLLQTGGTESPSNETVAILQRFAKVFDQTYTRFLDLQKAEAQAREAQIEVALEKIRSKSLAMHNSNELSDVIGVVFSQLNELKVLHSTVGIQLFDFNTKDSIIWPRNTLQGAAPKVMLPFDEAIMNADTCHRDLWQAMSTGKTIFNKVYTRKQKDRWFKYIFANNSLDVIWESSRKTILQCEKYTVCFIPEKNSALVADSFDGSVYTDEEFIVLKRAAKVFEQAYIRFLDLQKAEGQAREAQIEAALERVRSRSMVMQKSEDLNDVAVLLFQQVAQLGIKTWTTGFNVWSDDGNAYTDYITSPQGNLIEAYTIDASQFPVFVDIANARRSGVDFWISYLEGDLLKETYRQLARFDSETQYDKMLEDGSQYPSHQYNHFVFGSKVSLMFITYDPVPESHDIFKRFGKVFEQTYTRFLDLKKAEAQAREGQIEAALEKVRSSSLAMHHSDELEKVVTVLFDKLLDLGLDIDGAEIDIFDRAKRSYQAWVATKLLPTPVKVNLPFDQEIEGNTIFEDQWRALETGEHVFNRSYSGKAKDDYFRYTAKHNESVIPEATRKFFLEAADWTITWATAQNSMIGFDSWTGKKNSEEDFLILKRFSRVFDQAYTRFLDLQKAEAQACEAQIESALEKVRSTSLAMHHSDELEKVVNALLGKLVDLGLHFDGAGINIFDREKRSFQVWVASKFLSAPIKVNVPFDKAIENNTIVQDLWRALDTGEHVFNRSYSGKAKNDYFRFVEKHNESRISAETGKHNLEADSWTVTFTAEKNSVIAFDSWSGQTTSEDDFQVLKRFARVFEQAYVRFLDLQKAETQARESQIQLALERLRARTMAMHYTLELSEVAEVLFAQLKDLGASLWGCGFNICRADDEYVERWMCRPDGKMMEPLMIPISIGPFERLMYDAWKDGAELINYEQGGAELQEAFESLRLHPSTEIIYKRVVELTDAHIVTAPTLLKHYVATYKYGYLWVMTTEEFEETQIFIRFAKVFEQTYTRFLDLKRAELQTREAQIEAALERVRSRTMAMHKSEELLDVITVVCEQLLHLGIKFGTVSFGKNSTSFDMDFWVAAPDLQTPIKIYAPYTDISIYIRLKAAHRERKSFFTDTFTADETKVWYQHVIDHNPSVFSQKSREYLLSRQAMTRTAVLLKNVILFIINHEIVRYSDEENEIFIRFANVFEQAYTRFLDLQKAEAQAREAKIEAALEKVRARTMGMQQSEELAEVAIVMFEQVKSFGLESWGCGFNIWDKDEKECTGWMSGPQGTGLIPPVRIPLTEHPLFIRFFDSRKRGEDFWVLEMGGDELSGFYHYMDTLPVLGDQLRQARKIGISPPTYQINHVVNFLHGNLIFITYEACPEAHDIFKRFGKVFEQTYTRFLDLQKAEAQAREARVEAALERLRARTMAMQRSTELAEAAQLLYQQFLALGVKQVTCAYMFVREDRNIQSGWTVLPDGTLLPELLDFPLTGDDVLDARYKSWKDKEPLHRRLIEGEENKRHHQFLASRVPSHISEDIFAHVPAKVTFYSANFSQGYLFIITTEPLSTEEENTLVRFSKVFEQTYTRFLDLEKAEAQARESQIQLALERVRARTMAMHQSKEVREVAMTMSDQLLQLGFEGKGCTIVLINAGTGDMEWWMGGFDESRFHRSYFIKNFDHPVHRAMLDGFIQGEKFQALRVSGELKRSYDDGFFIDNGFQELPDSVKDWMRALESADFSIAYNKHGGLHWAPDAITEEQAGILQRFASVFEQTYTRFLDLKNAEALAREAQIEVALERVRARAMAMHTAQELKEVAHELRRQIGLLSDKDLDTVAIHLNDELPDFVRAWAGSSLAERGDEIKEFAVDFPKKGLAVIEEALKHYSKGERDYQIVSDSKKLKQWSDFIFNAIPEAREFFEGTPLTDETLTHFMSFADFQGGSLVMSTLEQPDQDSLALLRRFSNVFGLAYRRFADLKQAEAQAREAQIEAALERVRSKTMAMRQSSELSDAASLLFRQVGELGIKGWTAGFNVWSDDNNSYTDYVVDPQGEIMEPYVVDTTQFSVFIEIAEARKRGDEFFVQYVEGERLVQGYQHLSRFADKGQFQKILSGGNAFPTQQYDHFVFGTKVSLIFITYEPVPEFHDIFKRFGRVFEQTYTRFLDLQKAEAQARESQIETALEKIRSRSLGMHGSNEIEDVVAILFSKLKELGLVFDGGAGIHIFSEGSKDAGIWVMSPELEKPVLSRLPYDEEVFADNAIIRDVWKAKETGESIINRTYPFEVKNRYFNYVIKHNDYFKELTSLREYILRADSYTATFIAEKNSLSGASSWTGQQFSDNDLDVLKRVARVFEQAYIRFLDLQKAEAQAREANIEAALERIRSRSLGMHKSEEILEVVGILFEKLKELGLVFDAGAAIHLFSENSRDASLWVMAPELGAPIAINHPYDEGYFLDNPIINDVWRAKDTGEHLLNKQYSFEQKNRYFSYIFNYIDAAKAPASLRDFVFATESYTLTLISEKNSLLGASSWTGQLFSEDDIVVLKRVARVFEQAYVRFMDLKKAEAQAREASIEAALEKIRSRSLGMHISREIKDVVSILFDKLKELGLEFDGRASIHLFSEGSKDAYIWVASHGLSEPVRIDLPFDEEEFRDNPMIIDVWQAKETGAHIINRIYSKKEKDKYFRYVFKYNGDKLSNALKESIISAENYTVSFIAEKNSLLGATSWSEQKFSESDVEVLKRVAHVFEQAYIRFLDLQKAEIHAKEAVRQASLDRVRAEIASMRTVQDLDRITPLIWSELTALNIPFIRCGVFIVNEQSKNVQSFLSTPDGKAIAVFELPFDTPGFVGDVLKNWLAKKVYVNHLDDRAMKDFADILVARGIFNSVEHYLSTAPKEGFYQHLLPFRQGMLYVGNLTQLEGDELDTLQLLADAFATAYARYDDFNQLELAKKQVDNALVDLKQAQQQLVQSEKMASLGELTAGIAHEIQNPLNFVNNFSEVSHELMDEVKAEIEAGNVQAAAELVESIKRNLEKITHHGKRADGIVKGMLQHSRTGSGQKEPININVLCDEYVRLAYHGYRAKDKSFNAKFETDFDSNLPKVSVIAQDIGRVILNLINNAFYAVNERSAVAKAMADTSGSAKPSADESKTETKEYSPTVIVSTKNLDNKIEVRVRDNGNGIPETIREKIFQPFFTTKPTGQGTGLGLSLAYDIVTKAHGGKLEVSTTEGEGTEFIVTLPQKT